MKKFHVTHKDRRGYNKIYDIKRSRCFFFELADLQPNTNDIHLLIHTNDYHISTTPLRYKSTSRMLNANYQISKMLTHFFVLQKVLPRRIQQKYFQMIKRKLLDRINVIKSRAAKSNSSNRSTKTFFNFTYKKYRFYLGIYTPCNQYYDPNLPSPNNIRSSELTPIEEMDEKELDDHRHYLRRRKQCTVPSPFIMGDNRSACVMHQRYSGIFTQTVDLLNSENLSTKNKESERCFYKWRHRSLNKVKSSRLGITYTTQIYANGGKFIKNTNKGSIYQKAYSNFEIDNNYTQKTLKKQERRRKRAENRVFRTNTDNPITLAKEKEFVARKHKQLFKNNQIIIRPIHHLRYNNQRGSYPVASDYPFRIPTSYFVNSSRYKPRKYYSDLENASSERTLITLPSRQAETHYEIEPSEDSTSTYTSLSKPRKSPDINLSSEQAKIDVEIEPSDGSTSTTIALPKLRKSRYKTVKDLDSWIALPEDVAAKLDKKYLPFVPTKPLYSRSKKHYYPPGSADWIKHLKEAYRIDQIRIAQENGRKLRITNQIEKANDLGTSVTKLEKRQFHTKKLTNFQNRFHKIYKSNPKQKFSEDRINLHNQESLSFKLGKTSYDSADTSDNTKELEKRPRKRTETMEPRVDPIIASLSKKKQKIILTGDDDHLEKEN
jgi:hypothetical protein